ncbi:pectate lyase (plasmid) [Saccharobesus litoralis]|uniref:Pectate lyase n=2 Tax=Saccharobesus litoralis TaxID=2172099 RepID=A0A2S0VYK6_9ALTE|nr:pectate lyase [Saccharobesus litoralis]
MVFSWLLTACSTAHFAKVPVTKVTIAKQSGNASLSTLPQQGNPVNNALNQYQAWLSSASTQAQRLQQDQQKADVILSWQLASGGFFKHKPAVYLKPWDGQSPRSGWLGDNGTEVGTIDNNATVSEILFLANVFQRSHDKRYKDAARRALDYLLIMQYPTGGWPQVYPTRSQYPQGVTAYSSYVTFNDNAMIRVLLLLDLIKQQHAPVNNQLFSAAQHKRVEQAIATGIRYILKAQIKQNGVKTVWCAQHDPVTYAPKPARIYELASKSGSESVLITSYLMSQPQTPEIKQAVLAALRWFDQVGVKDRAYVKIKRENKGRDPLYNPIQAAPGKTMWYRFYQLEQDVGFFSDRDGGVYFDIMAISQERREGYSWAGTYPEKLFKYAQQVGYYTR